MSSMSSTSAAADPLSPRTVLRTVLIVLLVLLAVYVLYRLRKPISWIVHRDVPRDRDVRAGEPARAPHAARLRDRDRLPDPARSSPSASRRSSCRRSSASGNNLVDDAARLRRRPPGLRQQEPDAAGSSTRTTTSPTSSRRRRPSCRPRPGGAATTLADIGVGSVNSIFAGRHDPHPVDLHGGRRRGAGAHASWRQSPDRRDRVRARCSTTSPPRSASYMAGALAQATDRRHHHVHRADDPRRALRGAAGRADVFLST